MLRLEKKESWVEIGRKHGIRRAWFDDFETKARGARHFIVCCQSRTFSLLWARIWGVFRYRISTSDTSSFEYTSFRAIKGRIRLRTLCNKYLRRTLWRLSKNGSTASNDRVPVKASLRVAGRPERRFEYVVRRWRTNAGSENVQVERDVWKNWWIR